VKSHKLQLKVTRRNVFKRYDADKAALTRKRTRTGGRTFKSFADTRLQMYYLHFRNLGAIVLGSVVGFFLLCVGISLLIYCCLKRHNQKQQSYRKPLLTG